ncbi:hypothetical protein BC937DRAFT_94046 [Endogone sp. FLAS-F59071]|nr:hypothetical protein BC937DRAFT_94046 [Endogone sp. FLAS-F59071]|eukprot:RUS14293.1 hypothetical protein BC937DRAFT_94046 [Endogone sp. FLAS-F59071]
MPPLYDNHSTKRPRTAYVNGMADLPKPENPAGSAAAATTAMTTSAPPSTALLFDSTVPVTTSTTSALYGQNALGDLIMGAANLFSKTNTSAGGVQLLGGSGGNINFANNSSAAIALMPHNIVYATDEDEDDSEDDVGAVTWKLSLSPSSMTLDTNIQDVAGLYEVIEQLSTNVADAKIKEIKPVTNDYDDSDTERTESSVRRNKPSGRMIASPAATILFEVAGDIKPPSLFDHSKDFFLHQDLLSQCIDVFFTCYNRRLFHVDRASLTPNNLLWYSVCAVAGKHTAQSHLGMDPMKSDVIAHSLFLRARASLEEALLSDGDDTSSSAETTLLSLLLLAHAPGYCVRNTYALKSTHATMFITMALGIVYDLGLHRLDAPASLGSASKSSNNPLRTPGQTERLRRLAWLTYITDYRVSYAAQIPSIIRDDEPLPGWHVRWPEPIENEDDEQSNLGVIYLAQVARLTEWRKSNAMRRLYAPPQRGDRVPARVVWDLEHRLKNWHHQLPKWLQYDPSRKFSAATSVGGSENAEKQSKLEQFKVQLGWMINMDYHSAWLQLHLLLIPKRFAGQIGEIAGERGRKGEGKEEEGEEEEEEATEPHNALGYSAQEQAQEQRGRSQISTFSSRASSSQSSLRSSASPRASLSRSPSPEPGPRSTNFRLSALRSLRLCLESANAIVTITEAAQQHSLCEFDVDAIVAASSIYLMILGAPKPLPAQVNYAAFEAITRMAAIDILRLVRVTTKTVMMMANEPSFQRLVGYLNAKRVESGIILPAEKGAATQVTQILANHVKGLGVVA